MKKFFILLFVLTLTSVTSYAQPEDAKYVKVRVGHGWKILNVGYRVYCEGMHSWAEKKEINWEKKRCIGVSNDVFSLGFYYYKSQLYSLKCFGEDLWFSNLSDDKVLIEWRETKFTERDYPVTGLTAHKKENIKYANVIQSIPEIDADDFYKSFKETGELQIRRREVPFYIIHGGKTHTYNIVFELAYPWKMIDSKDKIE